MGEIHRFLAADHDRLDALLGRDDAAFRRGLLKHVGMEELILLPAIKKLAGRPAALARRVRLDHAALTALLVPTPTPLIHAAIRTVLTPHNVLEEREGGLYEECERALGPQAARVLEELRSARDIPPAAHADGPHVMRVVRRALAEAGYPDVAVE